MESLAGQDRTALDEVKRWMESQGHDKEERKRSVTKIEERTAGRWHLVTRRQFIPTCKNMSPVNEEVQFQLSYFAVTLPVYLANDRQLVLQFIIVKC